ncbi:FAD-dependent oxidoreductase [Paraburkholderia sp. JHI869]|uniref:flavin monoamine oxidase family protein n=1 Tax=Paraburkholderia sp. JHI869 TaxID=3112959 RepID=UPI00316CE26B
MKTARVAIVGGGLSGVYAAWQLEQHGIRDYVLLEARPALGGRILSTATKVEGATATGREEHTVNRFDLGPTWFWPSMQPEFGRLITDLGLTAFEQYADGDMVFEQSATERPVRMRGYIQPDSMRLVGGMRTLVETLYERLEPANVLTERRVSKLQALDGAVQVTAEDFTGAVQTWSVEHVLLALPPRLAEATIKFDPVLPRELARQWQSTATWMAPHAKYIAIYETPFWRELGLSGEARSARGPLAEIHDASMPGGRGALFGFLGVPAQVRSRVSSDVLRTHCRAQLVRIFGEEAANTIGDRVKDWAIDPFTATESDLSAELGHPRTPEVAAKSGAWFGLLHGIASEWSREYPGYLAGAIEAADSGVRSLLRVQG